MKLFVVCCSCLGDSMVIFQKKKALEHNAPRLWRRKRDSILAAARSRSRKNNTQLFSNALAPLRYPCLLGKRFSIQRALSSRIGRSQARYSVASLLTMCARHSLEHISRCFAREPQNSLCSF